MLVSGVNLGVEDVLLRYQIPVVLESKEKEASVGVGVVHGSGEKQGEVGLGEDCVPRAASTLHWSVSTLPGIWWPKYAHGIRDKLAAIQYGIGSIAGYFSQDSVTVGDLVVKDQEAWRQQEGQRAGWPRCEGSEKPGGQFSEPADSSRLTFSGILNVRSSMLTFFNTVGLYFCSCLYYCVL